MCREKYITREAIKAPKFIDGEVFILEEVTKKEYTKHKQKELSCKGEEIFLT